MPKRRKKIVVGWIKEGIVNMPPMSSKRKHFYKRINIYNNSNPVKGYPYIKFNKVRITIEVYKPLEKKGG